MWKDNEYGVILNNAKQKPTLDTKLTNEFYDYIGVPPGYIRYSNQHEKIVTELLSIYKTNREKLADIYLLILAAFCRTSDEKRERRRLFASEFYQGLIDRNSPWIAEAFYQRANMLEGTGNDGF